VQLVLGGSHALGGGGEGGVKAASEYAGDSDEQQQIGERGEIARDKLLLYETLSYYRMRP
jgi:hypothetical protein